MRATLPVPPSKKKDGWVRLFAEGEGYAWERFHPDGTLQSVSGGNPNPDLEDARAHAKREADGFGGVVEDETK